MIIEKLCAGNAEPRRGDIFSNRPASVVGRREKFNIGFSNPGHSPAKLKRHQVIPRRLRLGLMIVLGTLAPVGENY